MHHAEVVGGDKEVNLLETPDGDFKIQTQEHEYPLDADNGTIQKAQIQPEDIKRISSLEDAGVRGGIHSKHTWLVALHDGSLWIAKKTGAEERDEVFTYELAKLMFRSIVPETTVTNLPKIGWVSIQRKVSGVPAGRVDGLHGYMHGNEELLADLAAMLVLDFVIGNPDRHSNNWFLLHNDRLAAIDNGWAGEDMAMSFADVFQPARLAGMMEDERLWPQLLRGINALIQDLSGRGDEVRALAEAIGINKREAVDMVRLWEPKLASMAKLIRAEAGRVEKARTYLKPGQQPPEGTQVEEGPRGGRYYESEGRGAGLKDPTAPRAVRLGKKDVRRVLGQVRDYAKAVKEMVRDSRHYESKEEVPVYGPDGDIMYTVPEQKLPGVAGDWQKTRAYTKHKVTQVIAERTGRPFAQVRDFIKSWAGSASDKSHKSISMQMAAAEFFSIEPTPHVKEVAAEMGPQALEMDAARDIVREMYRQTQQWLEGRGIKKLVLFRGMKFQAPDYVPESGLVGPGLTQIPEEMLPDDPGARKEALAEHSKEPWEAGKVAWAKPIQIRLNPMSSFAIDPYEAWGFAGGDYHIRTLSIIEVPAERVIALPFTGAGCLGEAEVIVAGGESEMMVVGNTGRSVEVPPWFTDDAEWNEFADRLHDANDQYRKLSNPYH